MTDIADLARRLRRLEDREEIAELIARYGLAMDNREIHNIAPLFTPDAIVRSLDGVMNATGVDAIVAQFHGRFAVLGPSNHFSHDRIISFPPEDTDIATGLVLSHAEMNRKGQAMIAAIRYHDRYQRHAGNWRFSERVLTFFYYVPTAQYLDALGGGIARRMRAYDEAIPADWPEPLPSWQKYYGA